MALRKKFKKLIMLAISALTFTGTISSAIPVYAANQPVYSEYDEDQKGSITLYKYVSNDKKSISSTGTSLADSTDEQLDAIQTATGNYQMLPEKGVEFMYKRIGCYKQINTYVHAGKYIKYLDPDFIELLEKYGITLNPTGRLERQSLDSAAEYASYNPAALYDPDDVTRAMEELCKAAGTTSTGEEGARAYVKDGGTKFEETTSSYGKTVAQDLDTGLYMIAEVDWEHQSIAKHDTYWERLDTTVDAGDGSDTADIVSPSSPFLLQIPMNNVVEMTSGGKTYKPGEGYIYDVYAYPKNGTLTVHKDIVVNQLDDDYDSDGLSTKDTETICDYAQQNYLNSNISGEYTPGVDDNTAIDGDKTGLLTHQIDVNMGDTVRQVISADVPALIGDKLNKTYKITDKMTQGLSFKELKKVSVGTSVWNSDNNHVLTQDVDYTLSVDEAAGTFTVELTPTGLAYLDTLDTASYIYVEFDSILNNRAMIGTETYEYTTNDGSVVDATNQNTAMLTYATDRTSEHDYYSNTCKVYTYEMDLTKTVSSLKDGQDYTAVSFTMTGEVENQNPEQVQFIREGSGVYHIFDEKYDNVDEKTDTVACDATGKLVIKGVDAREYVITEVSTVKGNRLLAEPLNVKLEGHKLVEDYSSYFENGSLDHAYVWSGEKPAKISKYDIAKYDQYKASLEKGITPLFVTNNSTIAMLRTGGNGTSVFLKVGIAMIGLSAVLLLVNRKEKKNG